MLLYELFRLDKNEMVTHGIMSTARIGSVEDYQSISPTVEIITVENNACNDGVDTIQLEDFPNLRLLRVKSNSFYRVKTVSIANLPKLETVVVDSNCFAPRSLQYGEYSNLPKNSLALCHCPLLRILIIGEKSFSSYTQCTLSDLPSLHASRSVGWTRQEPAASTRRRWCCRVRKGAVLMSRPSVLETADDWHQLLRGLP